LSQGGPLEFELPVSQTIENPSAHFNGYTAPALPMRDELKRQERNAIVASLKQTNGKVSGPRGAAKLLGMKPSTLASRISSLGINRTTLG
jgi:transcriptional regulator with GAF, ATPase, and Fis domain